MPKKVSASMPIPPNFAAALRHLVDHAAGKGISQAQLAQKLRFDAPQFSRLVNGTAAAGPTTVARIALFLTKEEGHHFLEAYLADEREQVRYEQARLMEEYGLRKRWGNAPV